MVSGSDEQCRRVTSRNEWFGKRGISVAVNTRALARDAFKDANPAVDVRVVPFESSLRDDEDVVLVGTHCAGTKSVEVAARVYPM